MTTQFEMPGIALTRGCHSREGLGEGAEPEMGAMSWNMLWAPGLDAMEGSETMLLSLPWESPKLAFKELTFFSRCKGPELQDCLGQLLPLIRYGGLRGIGSLGYLGKGSYFLQRVESVHSGLLYIGYSHGTQGHRNPGFWSSFLKSTCSSLGVEI